MSEIEQIVAKQQAELRRFANVIRSNRTSVNVNAQQSFLTQTIQAVSR